MQKNFYQKLRMIIPGVIGTALAVGIITQNFIVPLLIIIIGIVILFFVKTRVEDVMQDERTFFIGSKAARSTIAIFVLVAVVISIILMSLRTTPVMWAVGQTLSYSVTAILFLYIILYKYYSNKM